MIKMYKYVLSFAHRQTLVIPTRKILSVMAQGNNVVVYALHDASLPNAEFNFSMYGTGMDIPTKFEMSRDLVITNAIEDFLGTVSIDGLVWHIFVSNGN